jgi:hypothetical protein
MKEKVLDFPKSCYFSSRKAPGSPRPQGNRHPTTYYAVTIQQSYCRCAAVNKYFESMSFLAPQALKKTSIRNKISIPPKAERHAE